MQECSLALADGPKLRREKQIPRFARYDKSAGEGPALRLDRSIVSGNGSRENWTQARERSTCTKLEQMRRRERVRNSAESSQPKAWRRRRKAVKSVVPLPEKGSRTKSPSLVEARRMSSRRATGFWVGCLPNFFSQDSGGRISQTDFICLPRLVSFMSL